MAKSRHRTPQRTPQRDRAAKRSVYSQASEKRVLLLIESSRAYGRGCLQGIASYLRAHPRWEAVHFERGLSEQVPHEVYHQRFDGVIARIENRKIEKTLTGMQVPIVDLRGMVIPKGGVTIDTDPIACAQKAFEHFFERGFRTMAYCGFQGLTFSDERCEAFCQHAEAKGVVVDVYQPNRRTSRNGMNDTIAREAGGETPEEEMIQWISQLPSPIGLFACNDMRGRQTLRASQLAGRLCPDEIAVLGVDDDEVICDLAHPSMSSIEPDTHRIGFEAARILSRLMDGDSVEEERILIPPIHTTVRRSTDLLAVDDPEVAKAIAFIRTKAFEGISVADIARHGAISRVTLERRFRSVLGRSPREEIERVRINQVRVLLAETNYSLSKIAAMTGFSNDSYLATAFRRHQRCTPGQYRKSHRL